MATQWSRSHLQLGEILWVFFMLCLQGDRCQSLNLEGLALLQFRLKIDVDPFGAFKNWNPEDGDPCNWSGVHCVDYEVAMLDLRGMLLEGALSPELGKLNRLRALILRRNRFHGEIPKEVGNLSELELMDLRENNLTGEIPMEIGKMMSLKYLFLCNNNFDGSTRIPLKNIAMFLAPQDGNCPEPYAFSIPDLKDFFPLTESNLPQDGNSARRRMLQESSNLRAAAPRATFSQDNVAVSSRGSGSFPAVPHSNGGSTVFENGQLAHRDSRGIPSEGDPIGMVAGGSPENQAGGEGRSWAYVLVLPGAAFFLTVLAGMLVLLRTPANAAISPWRTGLSGPLQKAFITGVPKLHIPEIEAACEEFSNIIQACADFTVFKGTLSSGVEIAVVASAVESSKDWSKSSQVLFQKKIDGLSRVNHKNFVNLLGYCEESDPFVRMMVFEYAPNGSLCEHLHEKDQEHLDWGMRMRIVMGMAYCLQHMHHDLCPAVVHPCLRSYTVFLTDDYAAKLAEMGFWKDVAARGKVSGDHDLALCDALSSPPETNVYDFGLLLLELVSGKHAFDDEQASVLAWAAEYMSDRRSIRYIVDPAVKSFKNSELEVICEVIQGCVHPDPTRRPTMREITARLQEVIGISPEAATPRLSPLWWAELEILTEAS